jgi:hypothetical protein
MAYKVKNGKAVRSGQTTVTADIRSWAKGSIIVIANDAECFTWEAEIQRRYLDEASKLYATNPASSARRAAGYLMAFGMPSDGADDMRPSCIGNKWTLDEVEVYKRAVLWLALHEHVPDTGLKVAALFVGKQLIAYFQGDRDEILAQTRAELAFGSDLNGTDNASITGASEFQVMIGVHKEVFPLNPDKAIEIQWADLLAVSGRSDPSDDPPFKKDDPLWVPRLPVDATEAKAMLRMTQICIDATAPVFIDCTLALASRAGEFADALDLPGPRTFCGYTRDELARGRTYVRVGG